MFIFKLTLFDILLNINHPEAKLTSRHVVTLSKHLNIIHTLIKKKKNTTSPDVLIQPIKAASQKMRHVSRDKLLIPSNQAEPFVFHKICETCCAGYSPWICLKDPSG